MISDRALLGAAGILGFVLFWELFAISGIVNPLFLPPFSAVIGRTIELFTSGEIVPHFTFSITNFLIGTSLAVLVGVPLGVMIGWYRRLAYTVEPLLTALYVMPFVALTPMIILIFGIFEGSKIAITFIAAFFPIVIGTSAGIKTVDSQLIRMARSFRANDRQLFRYVVIPSSLSSIVAGIRLGLGRGLIGIFVAELVASPRGLGFLTNQYAQRFDSTSMLGPILVVSLLGVMLTTGLRRVEDRLSRWRPDLE